MPSSPALILHFPSGLDPVRRDRIVGLLSDFDLTAIQEDDVAAPTRWLAHFASAAARDRARTALAAAAESAGLGVESIEVEDDDWARRTQADLPAVRIGRITVAPPWDLPSQVLEAEADSLVIEIEPSRGFGTGHHQSTRLCLVLLQGRDLRGLTVLDVGTGSGVLAIAAARLGAARVSAIDEDPDAIENARENIARNGVADLVEAHVRDVTTSPSPPAADLVLANLTGTLLARFAGVLRGLVRPGGSMVVSGFTVDEEAMVREAFAPGFRPIETAEEDGWWAFVLTPTAS